MVRPEDVKLLVGALASVTLFVLILWDAFNPAYTVPTQTIYLLLLLMSAFLGVDIFTRKGGKGGKGGGGSGGGAVPGEGN